MPKPITAREKIKSKKENKPLAAARKTKIKTFLKKKHAAGKINALTLTDDDALRAEMLALHGVSLAEYLVATGIELE